VVIACVIHFCNDGDNSFLDEKLEQLRTLFLAGTNSSVKPGTGGGLITAIDGKTIKLISSTDDLRDVNQIAPIVSSGSNDSYRLYVLAGAWFSSFDVIDFPKDHTISSNLVAKVPIGTNRYSATAQIQAPHM
jgi:hypothetical protein